MVCVRAAGVFEMGSEDETSDVQRVPALSSVGRTPLEEGETGAGGGGGVLPCEDGLGIETPEGVRDGEGELDVGVRRLDDDDGGNDGRRDEASWSG